ncbi:MAG: hypothetical protein HC890_14450 [Chloroflexaceae bacterium]|nr:hypothetical protein [Chloroflexaceae bacterium]
MTVLGNNNLFDSDGGLPERLPSLRLGDMTQRSLKEAFKRSGEMLYEHLEQIERPLLANEAFQSEFLHAATLTLFSKMRSNYRALLWLILYTRDPLSNFFVLEQLSNAAITLTYLAEEADEIVLQSYITTSIVQAQGLLQRVTEYLSLFPGNLELLTLEEQLRRFLLKAGERLTQSSGLVNGNLKLYSETESTATLIQRAEQLGLRRLVSPARRAILSIEPGSWLAAEIHALYRLPGEEDYQSAFRELRDVSHTCLHAARAFLEAVVDHYQQSQMTQLVNVQLAIADFNLFFNWFFEAYNIAAQGDRAAGSDRS